MFNKLQKKVKGKLRHIARQNAIQHRCTTKHYGAQFASWTVCKDYLTSDSIVYSFGIGHDISFDLEIIADYNLSVHAFDPTPRVAEWITQQSLPSKFHFHDFGIASYTGTSKFYAPDNQNHISHSMYTADHIDMSSGFDVPVYTLDDILSQLNHQSIDILKLDIEGAEYEVLDSINFAVYDVKQILIEFHHRWDAFDKKQTDDSIRRLQSFGYKIFSISTTDEEIGLIKL